MNTGEIQLMNNSFWCYTRRMDCCT